LPFLAFPIYSDHGSFPKYPGLMSYLQSSWALDVTRRLQGDILHEVPLLLPTKEMRKNEIRESSFLFLKIGG
jgi:hypothetical protein